MDLVKSGLVTWDERNSSEDIRKSKERKECKNCTDKKTKTQGIEKVETSGS